MPRRGALIGRDAERALLDEALRDASRGTGALVLLAGDAGVGKTALADTLAADVDAVVARGAATPDTTTPYGPIVAAMREFLRVSPDGLAACGPLCEHLALILPELGSPPEVSDRPALFEAIRRALASMSSGFPTLLILDDLQWSDEATLELLAALAAPLSELPVLVVVGYRSDELPREHRLRWLRAELRRANRLREIALRPLDRDGTRILLERALGDRAGPALVRVVHDRTQGIPFFVEELGSALLVGERLRPGRRGLELVDAGQLPVPETVRETVLLRMSGLSVAAREAAEVSAVAGERFELGLIAPLVADEALLELIEHGWLVEGPAARVAFRHALTREAIYADVPWLRRRRLHGLLAEAVQGAGGASIEVAAHCLGAREPAQARMALVKAVEEYCRVHAYRDAAHAARQALELWPEDEEPEARVDTLQRYAHSSELAGDLSEAARAWRELISLRQPDASGSELGAAHRRLAGVYELQGDRERAIAARRVAGELFAADGCHAEAAIEHLLEGNHMRAAGEHGAAVELARAAAEESTRAGRVDLRARALGLEGLACAQRGEFEPGLETVRAGLSLALEQDLTAIAGELYQRLGVVLENGADYRRSHEALETALGMCRASGATETERACLACMTYVLRELGQWQRSVELCRQMLDAGTARLTSEAVLGSIRGFRGELVPARQLLSSSLAAAARTDQLSTHLDCAATLAWVAHVGGHDDEAAEHCRSLLSLWEPSEDHHYAVWGLRWAATFFAGRGDGAEAHACAEALTRIASASGRVDALAALAHALGEAALLEGDIDTAADQLLAALELHRTLDIPFERAQINLRAGVVLVAAGERDQALERFGDAYRTARKLGARPLIARAANEVAALGESLERRLGRRAAAQHEGAGLTRRELEVVRLLASGRTNRAIARELFLSPRTIDAHVRNILMKLDCRSRTEAASRAGELGLLP